MYNCDNKINEGWYPIGSYISVRYTWYWSRWMSIGAINRDVRTSQIKKEMPPTVSRSYKSSFKFVVHVIAYVEEHGNIAAVRNVE